MNLRDSVHVSPAQTTGQAKICGTVFAKAFENDEYWQWIYTPNRQNAKGKQKDDILRQGLKQSKRTIMKYFLDPGAYVLLAIDGVNKEPAGFAVWLAPTTSLRKRYERKLTLWQRVLSKVQDTYMACVKLASEVSLHWLLLYPSLGISVLQRQRMWAQHTRVLEGQYISNRNRKQGYWQLSLLGVLPAFGGRGIAKKLLQFGMDKADEDDTVCYLSASPKGLPVYKKVGFKVIGADVCYPEDPQGGWTETFMVRDRRSERMESEKS